MKVVLISDFNSANLAGLLKGGSNSDWQVCCHDYGQHINMLVEAGPFWEPKPDICVIWTRIESVLPSFQKAMEGRGFELSVIQDEVERYAEILIRASERTSHTLFADWTMPDNVPGYGVWDFSVPNGVGYLLSHARFLLFGILDKHADISILNTERWMRAANGCAYDARLWYGAKIPFSCGVFEEAAKDIRDSLQALRGKSKKLIVTDLDDTLWGGIVGEVGWERLVLGGHDPIGEAFVDFQKVLKSLQRRGILLAIISKNSEENALNAIEMHPEMILRLDDFAGYRINWKDKAENLLELLEQLQLGLDATVFLDDSPTERSRMRQAFDDKVFVPDLPSDKRLYPGVLCNLSVFSRRRILEEDRRRAEMYSHERQRRELNAICNSRGDWLEALRMSIVFEALSERNLPRAAQLLNKTNQMNLKTRRMTESELVNWSMQPNRWAWVVRVSDVYGDSGISAMISCELADAKLQIVDFLCSCRVMGRGVEAALLAFAVEHGGRVGAESVHARFRATERNGPCLEFFRESDFRSESADAGEEFVLDLPTECRAPGHIDIVYNLEGN